MMFNLRHALHRPLGGLLLAALGASLGPALAAAPVQVGDEWTVRGQPAVTLTAVTLPAVTPNDIASARPTAAPVILAQAEGDAASRRNAGTGDPAGSDAQGAGNLPFSELNEALAAARARLAELNKAGEIAKVAGELRQELQAAEAKNRALDQALAQARSENAQLTTAKEAAEKRAAELNRSQLQANNEAEKIDEELVSMRWENAQLTTSLGRAENARTEAVEEAEAAKEELGARVAALTAAAEESVAEIARLQQALDARRQEVLASERKRTEFETELEQLRTLAKDSNAEVARLTENAAESEAAREIAQAELESLRARIDDTGLSLTAAEQENEVLREQVTTSRTEANRLRSALQQRESTVAELTARTADLEAEIEVLRRAANEATNAARLNLVAVEDQIDEINAALAVVKDGDAGVQPSGGPVVTAQNGNDLLADEDQPAIAEVPDWIPPPSPARASVIPSTLVAAASPEGGRPPGARGPSASAAPLAATVAEVTPPSAPRPANRNVAPLRPIDREPVQELAALDNDLSNEERLQIRNLLADLEVEEDARGLRMTVPGATLFAVNSEAIEPDAHDALARVAELISIYDDRGVLIVGHTDAVGDAGYNLTLSERRADLVKDFFIENFAIDGARLRTEGQGEQQPISSNATLDGRQANRRVEVLILN
jgi:outer membrane protein OmpA-like peptidoglycan-associated protein